MKKRFPAKSGPTKRGARTATEAIPPSGGSMAAILDAAKVLFLTEGYDGVNLELIASNAGVSRQTLYNQFGSKEAIFRAMVHRHWEAVTDAGSFLTDEAGGLADDPEAFFRNLATSILRFIKDHEQVAFTKLVIAEARHHPWIAEEFYRIGKGPLLEQFSSALRRMTDKGLLRCDNADLAARQFLGVLQELVFWPHVMSIGPDVERLPDEDEAVDASVKLFLTSYGRKT
jgi:TetR/AcrR family transcriptional regulator of autoinduction and epiphytic fitness